MIREWTKARASVSRTALAIALTAGGAWALPSLATAQTITASTVEEVVVTARKRGEENVQDVPLAVTAFSGKTLDALNFDDLSSLSYVMPNVSLEDIGTAPGIANFTIRGIGINSSIVSIDPEVGVFIDGMYIGNNAGVVFDNFDLEGVEVLRGPQGVLFGRNVSGGAVVLRTTTPTEQFRADARVSVETGDNYTFSGVVSGGLAPGLSGKIGLYRNDDGGWFTNKFDGKQFGGGEQTIWRGALAYRPSDGLEFILRFEDGAVSGDGPAGQNHGLYPGRDNFDFNIDTRGFYDNDWRYGIFETNIDVGFGAGAVTNIVTYREYNQRAVLDADATPNFLLNADATVHQTQWSEELRYAGTFGDFDVTTGAYIFSQDLSNIETRLANFPGPATLAGGGDGRFSTWGLFAAVDWRLTEQFTINTGVRYTHEEKDADISRIRVGGAAGGQLVIDNPNLSDSWNDVSPRIGFQWEPSGNTNVYGYWATGFRSGGINFRNTVVAATPNLFDSERTTTIELGVKHDFLDKRARINLAVFRNEVEGMQREINLPVGPGVLAQVVKNVGDATITGAEAEARFFVTDDLILSAQVGYLDGGYDKIVYDLSGNGTVGPEDLALQIPRLAPWTYGATVVWNTDVGSFGSLSSRLSYNHRDASKFTDNNRGHLPEADMVDANLTFTPEGSRFSISFYGTNLLDEATWGGDTTLPDLPPFGGDGAGPLVPTFSPLAKGRVIGLELNYRY